MTLDEMSTKVAAITKELATIHRELMIRNADERTRDNGELIIALSIGVAGWALAEATPSQLLSVVDQNKTSHLN